MQLMRSPPLVGELNHYFNANTCGIGWHGDAERKLVAGARFGPGAKGMPFKMQWFYKGVPVGKEARIELDAGDIYIFPLGQGGGLRLEVVVGAHAAPRRRERLVRVRAHQAYTKRERGEAHPVTVFRPPPPLTMEQMARIETNKQKALAIRAAKEEARVAAKA